MSSNLGEQSPKASNSGTESYLNGVNNRLARARTNSDESAAASTAPGQGHPQLSREPSSKRWGPNRSDRGFGLIRGMSRASSVSSFGFRSEDDDNDDENEDKNDSENSWDIERVRMAVKKIFVASTFGTVYDLVLLILSFLSCAQLIYQTYLDEDNERDMQVAEDFEILEMVLAVLFGFDWLLTLFLADVKSEFFMSFFSMVDLLTVIPVWFTRNEPLQYYRPGMTQYESFIYALNALSTFRVCRVFRVRRFLDKIENEVERQVGEICLVLLVGLVFFAAIIQFLERQESHPYMDGDKYHNWLYFAMITFTTVGYGDLFPLSALGQIMCCIFIMIAILLVPKMTNELADKIKATSPYSRFVFKKKGAKHAHVLICGDLSTTQLEELFGELFHDDHAGELTLTAVVLQPHPPSKAMFKILNHPIFSMSIKYLEGSPLSAQDLVRSKARDALAVFIFANKYSSNPDEEDAKVILQQLSIIKYVQATPNTTSPVFCMQLIRPEARRHLEARSNNKESKELVTNDDLVVCISELKMGILAKSVLYPGMGVLIFNFLSSFSEDEEDSEDEGDSDEKDLQNDDQDRNSWLHEYQLGCDWEIYSTPLNKFFEGAPFALLANSLYFNLKIVLIGLRVRHRSGKHPSRLVLNPGDWPIPSHNDYEVEGYVIAKNKTDADLSRISTADSDDGLVRISKLSIVAHDIIGNAMAVTGKVTGKVTESVGFIAQGARRVSHSSNQTKLEEVLLAKAKFTAKENTRVHETMREADWRSFIQREMHRENRSRQEKEQEEHEQSLRTNYYIRAKPALFKLAAINGYVTTEVPTIDDHIIIASRDLEYLYDLILPLRSKRAGPCHYIVILSPEEMSEDVWRRISRFEGILYVRGSSLEEKDLRRAGIYRCKQMVVLADGGSHQRRKGTRGIDKGLMDVDAVFTYQLVKRMSESTNVILEIVQEENIAYMDPEHNTTHQSGGADSYKFYPQFAGGRLFNPSLLDALLIQSYYNRDLINLMNCMLGLDLKNSNAGEQVLSDRSSNVASDAKRNPTRYIMSVKSSSLHQMGIPDGLSTMTYGAMFDHFSKQKVIPVGLLRGVSHTNKAKGNKIEYVVANPAPDTELETTDRVFVLCTTVTRDKIMAQSKVAKKDGLYEIHRQEGIRELKLQHHTLDTMDKNMLELKNKHKHIQESISTLSEMVMASKADAQGAQKNASEDSKESITASVPSLS